VRKGVLDAPLQERVGTDWELHQQSSLKPGCDLLFNSRYLVSQDHGEHQRGSGVDLAFGEICCCTKYDQGHYDEMMKDEVDKRTLWKDVQRSCDSI